MNLSIFTCEYIFLYKLMRIINQNFKIPFEKSKREFCYNDHALFSLFFSLKKF